MKIIETTSTKDERIEAEFKKALKKFVENKDLDKEYERFEPLGDKVLIKVFQFMPDEKFKAELGKTQILVQSKLDGSWKPSDSVLNEKIFPIIKVLKAGKAVKDIKAGEIYTVPYDEVLGDAWNPDFLHLVNSFGKSGNQGKLVNIPEGMPQRLKKLDIEWKRYKFSMPDRLGTETNEDKLVYLIPTIKLESRYLV